jgi:hypothetical protein
MLSVVASLIACLVWIVSVSPAAAQPPSRAAKPKVFIGYVNANGTTSQLAILKELVEEVGLKLRNKRVSVESAVSLPDWSVEKNWAAWAQQGITHYAVATTQYTTGGNSERALRVRWQVGLIATVPDLSPNAPTLVFAARLESAVDAWITKEATGSVAELQRWDQGRSETVKPPPAVMAPEISKAIKLFFPELDNAYKYYLRCFEFARVPPPADFGTRRTRLLGNVIEKLKGDELTYPNPDIVGLDAARAACNGQDVDTFTKADFLLSGVADQKPYLRSQVMVLRITVENRAKMRRAQVDLPPMEPGLQEKYIAALESYHGGAKAIFLFCPESKAWGEPDFATVSEGLATYIKYQLLKHLPAAPPSGCPPAIR